MTIAAAVAKLGIGPLTEAAVSQHIRPLFSQTLARDRIYLANHTLGRPLDQMHADLSQGAQLWSDALRDAWEPWLAEEANYRSALAGMLGLERPDCLVPKVSAGGALRAVLNTLPQGATVVTTTGEFASVSVVLAQYAALGRLRVVLAAPAPEGTHTAESVNEAMRREPSLRLVVVSHVFYSDAQVFQNLATLAAACRAHGAQLLVDCYHSFGVLPVDMPALGCDYLIGGCYKYLRGGPGAAFLALAPHVADGALRPLDTGWFAQEAAAGTNTGPRHEDGPALRAGGDAWLEGTPPVLTYYQARSGLAFTHAVGVERLRAYSLGQLQGLRALLGERGIATHGGDAAHGAFLTIATPDPAEVVRQLAQKRIAVDARDGQLRVCPDCLTTGDELEQFADAIASCLPPAH
jgi:kynureninase